MKMINASRGNGKTFKLVQECVDKGVAILCVNNQSAKSMAQTADTMLVLGYIPKMPEIVTIEQLKQLKDDKEVAIDEMQHFIENHFKVKLKTITGTCDMETIMSKPYKYEGGV